MVKRIRKTQKQESNSTTEVVQQEDNTSAEPPKKEKKMSITRAIYALFDEKGVDKVTQEEAREVALSIKPDSAWKKTHLYFHRKKYKDAHELQEV